ncbi:MAG: PaaI family thioesterase [Solirubrobacteraceae bacterium]
MSSEFRARDPEFQERVRASFAQQGLMSTFAARLDRVDPGVVEIAVPFADRLTQQDGFLHAGVVIAAMDGACGYAALSLMEPDCRVLTVELKVNLLSVASGERLLARGQVMRPGRTLTVCRGDAYVLTGEEERHVATILTTMFGVGNV